MEIQIAEKHISLEHPTYFIADIGANHDGSLERAKYLIRLAKQAGADAAKFQNFHASKIVSDYGFRNMGGKQSHQSNWKKSVAEVYQDASIPMDWTPELKAVCDAVNIHYFSSPYDFESIDYLEPYMPVYKAGSGEITWIEALERMARKGKPIMISTGASDIGEVQRAVEAVETINRQIVLMQCNTNYTGNLDNFDHIHLNVLKTYRLMFPNVILGLSDHTPGHAAVLGAVALEARVIEKHFTDDNSREGPDHPFAMTPDTWREMVDNTRLLEKSLGSTRKFVTENEQETVIVQRRCLRAARDIQSGDILTREMVDVLRPAVRGAISPFELTAVLGTRVLVDIPAGKELRWTLLGEGDQKAGTLPNVRIPINTRSLTHRR